MKKVWICSIPLIVGLVFSSIGEPATVGSSDIPRGPEDCGKIVIGFEENYIAERDLKHSNFDGKVQYESLQHLGTISYGLFEGVSLIGKIGVANLDNVGFNVDHSYKLAWGAGGKLDILKCLNNRFQNISPVLFDRYSLISSGQYFYIFSDKDITGDIAITEKWLEWQTSLYIKGNYGAFSPYVGVKLSWAEAKTEIDYGSGLPDFSGTLIADDHVGGFLGLNIDFSKIAGRNTDTWFKDLSLNFEVRAFDEFAFSSSIGYIYPF